MDPDASPTSETGSVSVTSEQSNARLTQSPSSEVANSTGEVESDKAQATNPANGNKIKSILNNPNDTLPRKQTRARSDSGFRAALKSTFLPPPVPGRQIKVKDGKPLGKSYLRCEPLPEAFEGGEVLTYDPRGENASAGDGVIPPACLISPQDRKGSFSDTGDGSDRASSVAVESEYGDTSSSSQPDSSERRGRQMSSTTGRSRNDSVASTSSSSGSAAIKFAPLPLSGRLKRANSISIGVAARSQLLQSQGTAAPPRQRAAPQHVHYSQDWYTDGTSRTTPEGVLDVGEELRKGANKAWKLLRGGTSSSNNSTSNTPATESADTSFNTLPDQPKKHFPKEGAPVPDPETGELRMAGGEAVGHTPKMDSKESESGARDKGDKTPKRSDSPTAQFDDLSIEDQDKQTDAAAAIQAAHLSNSKKGSRGHDPHDLEDGAHEETFHLAEEPDSHIDSGAATPRSAQRRLSTGGFLRGFSIRGIQEDRRRDLLGLDDDDEVDPEREGGGDHHRHAFTVRGPSGKEEELGLEGYGHSRPHYDEPQAA